MNVCYIRKKDVDKAIETANLAFLHSQCILDEKIYTIYMHKSLNLFSKLKKEFFSPAKGKNLLLSRG